MEEIDKYIRENPEIGNLFTVHNGIFFAAHGWKIKGFKSFAAAVLWHKNQTEGINV